MCVYTHAALQNHLSAYQLPLCMLSNCIKLLALIQVVGQVQPQSLFIMLQLCLCFAAAAYSHHVLFDTIIITSCCALQSVHPAHSVLHLHPNKPDICYAGSWSNCADQPPVWGHDMHNKANLALLHGSTQSC
jgi:type III secretory pathway component EscS